MTGRKNEIEQRRQRVKRLLAQGAGPSEMAERLEVSRSTVYRDLDAVEQEILDMEDGNIEDFLMELKANFDTVNQELWSLAYSSENESNQLGAYKQIVQVNAEMVDVLQKIGVLEKAAKEIQLSGEGEEAGIQFVIKEADAETATGDTEQSVEDDA